jgi:flagellar hook-basal body complex protein FliE
MPVNMNAAATAYTRVADSAAKPGMDARVGEPGKSFSDLVSDVAQTAAKAGHEAEKATATAMTGKADLNEVVMAVTNADVALQTVVAIRDRVIQAYQDILRMPI